MALIALCCVGRHNCPRAGAGPMPQAVDFAFCVRVRHAVLSSRRGPLRLFYGPTERAHPGGIEGGAEIPAFGARLPVRFGELRIEAAHRRRRGLRGINVPLHTAATSPYNCAKFIESCDGKPFSRKSSSSARWTFASASSIKTTNFCESSSEA